MSLFVCELYTQYCVSGKSKVHRMLLGNSVALGRTSAGQRGFAACAVNSQENTGTGTYTVNSPNSPMALIHSERV